MALTPRQQAFIDHYLANGFNGTEAAIRAGYAPDSAGVEAVRLLKKPHVRAIVEAKRGELAKKAEVTAERVVEALANIAFGDARSVMRWGPDGAELLPSGDLSPEAAALVAGVAEASGKDGVKLVRLKLHDRLAALGLLAKVTGAIDERPSLQVHQHLHLTAEGVSDKRLDGYTVEQLRAMVALAERGVIPAEANVIDA